MKRLRNELVGIYDVSSQRINKTVNNKKKCSILLVTMETQKNSNQISFTTLTMTIIKKKKQQFS